MPWIIFRQVTAASPLIISKIKIPKFCANIIIKNIYKKRAFSTMFL